MDYPRRRYPREFVKRTALIILEYKGDWEGTLLINSLLGLLVMPRERFLNELPLDDYRNATDWGLSGEAITPGPRRKRRCRQSGVEEDVPYPPESIRGIVHSMRNAAAHFHVRSYGKYSKAKNYHVIEGFTFSDSTGFSARISQKALTQFALKVASTIAQETVC